jgi:hypothetical protein
MSDQTPPAGEPHPCRDARRRLRRPGRRRHRPEGTSAFAHPLSPVNEWTEIRSAWEGQLHGALRSRGVEEDDPREQAKIRALFQHGQDPQIGDKPLGPICGSRTTTGRLRRGRAASTPPTTVTFSRAEGGPVRGVASLPA